MRVAVLGAGVTGVTTAYYLAQLGHSVTVFERAHDAASEASGDNGGQLSYSFTDAMANRSFLFKLPKMLFGLDPAILFRPELNTGLLGWGMSFLSQCTNPKARSNTLEILQIASRSGRLMEEIRSELPIDFSFRPAGKLVLLSNDKLVKTATASVKVKKADGCKLEMLSFGEACRIEPSLEQFSGSYKAAIWSQNDEVGDARAFTLGMQKWLTVNRGVEFRFNAEVQTLESRRGALTAIRCRDEVFRAEAAVVCLGAWSPRLLDPLGVNLRIYPVRGYSLTLPLGFAPASVSITDQASKIVFSKINSQVRIAGFADFTGFKNVHDRKRAKQLLEVARAIAPEIADYDVTDAKPWAGLRPMTPDSRPLVGPTAIKGLFLNTGHGMLGWTLAAATGHDIAQAVSIR